MRMKVSIHFVIWLNPGLFILRTMVSHKVMMCEEKRSLSRLEADLGVRQLQWPLTSWLLQQTPHAAS